MRDTYKKYRVHLLERLKMGSVASSKAEQGNSQRPRQLLLLLLLLGAVLLIACMVLARPF
jgi:hypothetical protein